MSDLTVHKGGSVGAAKPKTKGLTVQQKKIMKMYDLIPIIVTKAIGCQVALIDDNEGVRRIVSINENNEVRFVNDEYLVNYIVNYCQKFMGTNADYIWSHSDALGAVKIYKTSNPLANMPKKICFSSEDDLCFKRLPFDFVKRLTYQHPTWDLVLESIKENKEYFQYFIGSIFEDRSSNQGYMWLYGFGKNAKGSVLRFLKNILGEAYKSSDVPDDNNRRFFTMKLEGKRVCAMPDVTDFGFVRTGFWKQLTGGDTVDVEIKGGGFYDLKSECKFIVASNDTPEIKSSKDDMRRVVFVKFDEMEDIPDFETKLAKETHEFICDCIDKYRSVYEPLKFIAFDMSKNESNITLAEDYEALFEGIFNKYFEKSEADNLPVMDMEVLIDRIFHGSSRKKKDFKAWFRRKHHPLPADNVRIPDTYDPSKTKRQCKCYKGFKINTSWV